jgi:hypothetical protein
MNAIVSPERFRQTVIELYTDTKVFLVASELPRYKKPFYGDLARILDEPALAGLFTPYYCCQVHICMVV